MTAEIIYVGSLRTQARHIQSGTQIQTDAPSDNQGKGEKFSPTDLVATALGTCIITTMAIAARDRDLKLEGTSLKVEKIMASNPRRISEIRIRLQFPPDHGIGSQDREWLERVGRTCPVARSLSPDLVQTLQFVW